MENSAFILIIVANVAMTYAGFNNPQFLSRYIFHIDSIKRNREYIRMISSGFLHADWNHLLFNMFTLYVFSAQLIESLGFLLYLVLYFISLIAGNVIAYLMNRNNSNYRALGASGAVSGLVFAAIALYPGMKLALLFIPIFFPAWVFGLLYVLYSIYGMSNKGDNIGHEAHLGGGVAGLLFIIALQPDLLVTNTLPIALILIPTVLFILIMKFRPELLDFGKNRNKY